MSNELAVMADSLISLNTNIDAIKNLMTNDTLKKINESNNIKNNKSLVSDSIVKMNQVVVSTSNSIKENFSKVYDKASTTIIKPRIEKINKLQGVETNKPELVSKKKFYDKALDFLGMSTKYYKSELNDKNKNTKTSFFQRGTEKAINTKDKISAGATEFKNSNGSSVMNGIALAGLGLYALYEAFTSKVGKWTGTIKLMGKTLLKTADMMLSPVMKFTKTIASALSPKFLTDKLTSIGSHFTGAIKNMVKPFTHLAKHGLLKVVGVKSFKNISKLLGKVVGKSALKKIPIIGALIGLGFGMKRMGEGDIVGGLMEIASGVAGIFPGVGTALSIGIDLILARRDFVRGDNHVNKPVKLQFKSMFNSMKKLIMKSYPINSIVHGYNAFKSLASGNYKEALGFMGKSFLSSSVLGNAISYLIELTDDRPDTTSTIKESKFEINNTLKKQLESTTTKTKNNIENGLEGINKDLDNVVTSVFSDNIKYLNKNNVAKINEKKEKDKTTAIMINQLQTISGAVTEKNEYDKSKDRFDKMFNDKNGMK